MNYLFCDLDDTLFQSRRKTPVIAGLTIAATSPDGEPNGFMTPAQRSAFDALTSSMTFIPVTARDLAAYSRVQLPAAQFAIINHGGIILDLGGHPDEEWLTRSSASAKAAKPWLEELFVLANEFIRAKRLATSSRIISDFGLPFYWLSKYRDGHEAHLDCLEREFIRPWLARWSQLAWVHRNGNNLAVLPQTLQKASAVRYMLERLRKSHPDLVAWGMGDSTSDIPFITECDYLMAPARSQIATQIAGALK